MVIFEQACWGPLATTSVPVEVRYNNAPPPMSPWRQEVARNVLSRSTASNHDIHPLQHRHNK
eukprot:3582769-Amphidinium_carterae.1